ncbi:MAG: hypothetical protein ABEK59_02350, partial [Halobacteria archaeon]
MTNEEFAPEAYAGPPVFLRTYSRKTGGQRERWSETADRALKGLKELGNLTEAESEQIGIYIKNQISLPSGRWLWVGGTDWAKQQRNYLGCYNCAANHIDDPYLFGHLAYMAMQGTGTGAVLEESSIQKLPIVANRLKVEVIRSPGEVPAGERKEKTELFRQGRFLKVIVGDSKEGWRDTYQALIDAAYDDSEPSGVYEIEVRLENVRPKGEKLKGFGGVANPNSLHEVFPRVAEILNGAVGRKLNAEECCLLIDVMAEAIVAGNLRRTAGLRQFDADAPLLKMSLWQQTENGWQIDPKRSPLRMANHSRVWHSKPDYETIRDAVEKQHASGEGAIFYAPEAIARANADIFPDRATKRQFIQAYENGKGSQEIQQAFISRYKEHINQRELNHRLSRYSANPCLTGETQVLTRQGPEQIKDLVGRTVEIWDGSSWVTVNSFRQTGRDEKVFRIELSNGDAFYATAYHNHVISGGSLKTTLDLEPGDKLETHTWGWSEQGPFKLGSAVIRATRNLTVKSVAFSHVAPKVYCCTVPTTNRFALANG